jgi:hypothetical protein
MAVGMSNSQIAVAQRHRLLVGEHLVAGPDDAHDLTGVGRDERFFVGHRDIVPLRWR